MAGAPAVYQVTPPSQPLPDGSVTAEVRRTPSGDGWLVTVLIVRRPDQPQIPGSEVQAQLIDARGNTLRPRASPSGPLVEAGGSLGVSANAPFEFADPGTALAELVVSYQGKDLRFTLKP